MCLDHYQRSLASVYNSSVDPQSYGDIYGFLRRNRSGGDSNRYELNGSRCGVCQDGSTTVTNSATARGCMNNCIILGLHGMEHHIGYYMKQVYNILPKQQITHMFQNLIWGLPLD